MSSNHMRERRLEFGLTQGQAAAQAGITREEWNALENKRRGLGMKNAVRVTSVLGGNPEDYLSRPVRTDEVEELRQQLTELKERVARLELVTDLLGRVERLEQPIDGDASITEIGDELGKRIRTQRLQLNLSQVEAAEHLGIAVRTLQNWETGTAFPWPKHRRALERFLKTKPT
jgi:transcriptional regulator with XRE-family HTH domain